MSDTAREMAELKYKDYCAGMDCNCMAYGEHECSCVDADWTPKEVYILQSIIDAKDAEIKRFEGKVAVPVDDVKAAYDEICGLLQCCEMPPSEIMLKLEKLFLTANEENAK